MTTQLNLSVQKSKNCPEGMPVQTFNVTPETTWEASGLLKVWLGTGDDRRECDVIGWSARAGGTPAPLHVVKTTWHGVHGDADYPGYLVYGGDAGVRILDPRDGLVGMACLWVDVNDADDLPAEVLAVVDA